MQIVIDVLSFIFGLISGLFFWIIWDWYKLKQEKKKWFRG